MLLLGQHSILNVRSMEHNCNHIISIFYRKIIKIWKVIMSEMRSRVHLSKKFDFKGFEPSAILNLIGAHRDR